MAEVRLCDRCGAPLPASPVGVEGCPRCLLALGLITGASESESGVSGLPTDIGGYSILDVLSYEDTWVVYLAEAPPPDRRRVALKVVRLAPDPEEVLTRFHAMRDGLDRVSHPGIAEVLDAGTAPNGRPFFVVEWIPGVPMVEYCDRERLTIAERLRLFAQACDAIGHAHDAGVVHGGLKASTVVVVGEPEARRPRVLDLGVSLALGPPWRAEMHDSALGLLSMAPYHLAPELSHLPLIPAPDTDARTDVYALGALLYELLVGAPLFDPRRVRKASWTSMVRIIQQETPASPSVRLAHLGAAVASEVGFQRGTSVHELARQLRGDLDWITLKALEKDPSRRYRSAGELGLDVRRHLRRDPVEAGPRGLLGRLARLVTRSRFP